jgi:hypothetical protein
MKVEIEINRDGGWLLKLHGVEDRESLALAQHSMAEALGELAWEALNKQPLAVIEKGADGSIAKSVDEKTHAEQSERRRRARP